MEHIGYISPEELYLREERCKKAWEALKKAMLSRLLIGAVLIWSLIRSGMPLWAVALMMVALVLNLFTKRSLWQEWRRLRKELKDARAQME